MEVALNFKKLIYKKISIEKTIGQIKKRPKKWSFFIKFIILFILALQSALGAIASQL